MSLQVWLQNVWREVSIQSKILWCKNILSHYTSYDITIEYIKSVYREAEVMVGNQGSLIYLWARSTYFLVHLHQSSSYIKKWILLALGTAAPWAMDHGQSRSEEFYSVCYIIIYHIYFCSAVLNFARWSR